MLRTIKTHVALVILLPIGILTCADATQIPDKRPSKWVYVCMENPSKVYIAKSFEAAKRLREGSRVKDLNEYADLLFWDQPWLQYTKGRGIRVFTGMWLDYDKAMKKDSYHHAINSNFFNFVKKYATYPELCVKITTPKMRAPYYAFVLDMTERIQMGQERFSIWNQSKDTWVKCLDLDSLSKRHPGNITYFQSIVYANLAATFTDNTIVVNFALRDVLMPEYYPSGFQKKSFEQEKTISQYKYHHCMDTVEFHPYPGTGAYHRELLELLQSKGSPHFDFSNFDSKVKCERLQEMIYHKWGLSPSKQLSIKLFVKKGHEHHRVKSQDNLHEVFHKLGIDRDYMTPITMLYVMMFVAKPSLK